VKIPISVDTKLIPLIGTPLRQSFSPRMQNAAYQKLGIDAVYFPLECGNEGLEDVIKGLRHMNVGGLAITKPNKVEAIKYLDELDELAQKMGAVNTVVIKDGKLIGYNTDGFGAVKSLIDDGVDIKASKFFCLGAGGAGRAMAFTLAHFGAKHLYICSKSNSGHELAEDLNKAYGDGIASSCTSDCHDKMIEFVKDSDVLLNNAGIGMYPNLEDTWIDYETFSQLEKKPVCFDATYNPLKTKFLQDADKAGFTTINGIGMVINQGAEQMKLWLGIEDALPYLNEEINKIIEETSANQ